MFLREYIPMIWRWCASCGDRPVYTQGGILCRGCNADLELELERI